MLGVKCLVALLQLVRMFLLVFSVLVFSATKHIIPNFHLDII